MNIPGAANPCSPVQLSSTHLPRGGPKRLSGDSEEMSQSPTGLGQPKRRGRPPGKFFKQVEQHYLTQPTAQPIPPGEQACLGWGKHGSNRNFHCGSVIRAHRQVPVPWPICIPSVHRDVLRLVVDPRSGDTGCSAQGTASPRHPGEGASQTS